MWQQAGPYQLRCRLQAVPGDAGSFSQTLSPAHARLRVGVHLFSVMRASYLVDFSVLQGDPFTFLGSCARVIAELMPPGATHSGPSGLSSSSASVSSSMRGGGGSPASSVSAMSVRSEYVGAAGCGGGYGGGGGVGGGGGGDYGDPADVSCGRGLVVVAPRAVRAVAAVSCDGARATPPLALPMPTGDNPDAMDTSAS